MYDTPYPGLLNRKKRIDFSEIGQLSDTQLWALFWKGKSDAEMGESEKGYLERLGGQGPFLMISAKQLVEDLDFPKSRAFLWEVFREMAKRRVVKGKNKRICSPKDIFESTRGDFIGLKRELCMVIGRGKEKELLFKETVSVGNQDAIRCEMRDIFRSCIVGDVAEFALVHNHPSALLAPSKEDLIHTQAVREAGQIFGIQLIDHLIVQEEHYLSFYEMGYLPKRENY
jgi:DNA repair protein RadC